MAVKSLDAQLCDGCGICIEDCPVDVFKLDPVTHKAMVAYNRYCCECYLCEKICPKKAIQVTPATERTLWHPF